MSNDNHLTLLRDFLAHSRTAGSNWSPNSWYSTHHHLMGDAAKGALGSLSADERGEYYYYCLLYRGRMLQNVRQADLSLALQAYDRYLANASKNYHARAKRHEMLLLTGYDDLAALPSGRVSDIAEIKRRERLLTLIERYTHMPGMRAKAAKFQALAGSHGRLAGEVLHHRRHRGPQVTIGGPDEQVLYNAADLTFWGLVFCALFEPAARGQLLHEMWENTHDLPQHDQHLSTLNQFVQAIIELGTSMHPVLDDYGQKLSDRHGARVARTDSVALANSLNLPFTGDDWSIKIAFGIDGNENWFSHPNVTVDIQPNPDREWAIGVCRKDGRFYQHSGKTGVSQNDIGIEPLAAGGLINLPEWLNQTIGKYNLRPLSTEIRIFCGKYRKAVKPLRAWLAI